MKLPSTHSLSILLSTAKTVTATCKWLKSSSRSTTKTCRSVRRLKASISNHVKMCISPTCTRSAIIFISHTRLWMKKKTFLPHGKLKTSRTRSLDSMSTILLSSSKGKSRSTSYQRQLVGSPTLWTTASSVIDSRSSRTSTGSLSFLFLTWILSTVWEWAKSVTISSGERRTASSPLWTKIATLTLGLSSQARCFTQRHRSLPQVKLWWRTTKFSALMRMTLPTLTISTTSATTLSIFWRAKSLLTRSCYYSRLGS